MDYKSGLSVTIKEGAVLMIGEARVTVVRIGGHGIGKAVRLIIKAPEEIKISRLREEKAKDAPGIIENSKE